MLPSQFLSPAELAAGVAHRARERRLAFGFTRQELAARSGMSAASLKRFERTGRIAFDALIRLGIALASVDGFDRLFERAAYASIDEILQKPPRRQRGRRRRPGSP